MTRSNGPYDQAPNWRHQSRAGHDQTGDDQHQQQWHPGPQDHDQAQSFGAPPMHPTQDHAGYQAQHDQAYGYRGAPNEPPFDPYQQQQQPPAMQPVYNDEPQPMPHSLQSHYNVPPAQPSLGERMREADQVGFDDTYGRPDLRPTTHEHHLQGLPGQAQPGAMPSGQDVSAYDLGNYTPSGALQAERPAFGEPGYAPGGEWDFGSQGHGEPQQGVDQLFEQPGFQPEFEGQQQGAVTEHGDVYSEDNDDEYDYEYEDEERGTSRKLVIAGALVSAIVVGGGFAFGYNALFSPKSGESGPPVVKADAGPAKVQPSDPGGRKFEHTSSKLMGKLGGSEAADRAASASTEGGAANRVRSVSTLVVGRDGRLIVPDASQPSADSAQVANAAPAAPDTTSPVPGMTIVGGAPPMQPAALGASNVQPSPPPIAAAPTPPPIQPAAQPPEVKKARSGNLPPLPERPGDDPRKVASAATSAGSASGTQQANVRPVVPQTRPRAQPAPAATAAPVQKTAARPAAPAASNGYVAVLSTKRSRIDALTSFADLQQKYGSILSTKVPDVRRADLSSRGLGVMYRAVVGPPASRQAASQLCSRLKSAGYSGCWVTAY